MRDAISKSLALIIIGFCSPVAAHADSPSAQPLSGWELGAYFDVYNQSSAEAHAGTPAWPHVVSGRLFDSKTNVTTVNMAELSARKTSGKTLFRIDAAFGDMVDGLSAATEPTRNITQAFVTYKPIESLALTFGKMYTPIGFEVVKAGENWQYSRSYTFNFAIPLWHQGMSAAYTVIPSKFTGTIYAVNNVGGPISTSTGSNPALGVALNGTPAEQITANYVFMTTSEPAAGEGMRELHDVNVTYNFSQDFAAAADYTSGTQRKPSGISKDSTSWSGLSVYGKARFGFYTLSPRYEIFDDSDSGYAINAATKVEQKLTSLTLTNKFDLDPGLEVRFEYRTDKSDKSTYFRKADGSASDGQDSFTVALLYVM